MTTETELYTHWSHRNFTAGQWREAAKRYLELCVEMNKLKDEDRKIDHEALGEFDVCETCRLLVELNLRQRDFSQEFANLWAIRALKGDAQ